MELVNMRHGPDDLRNAIHVLFAATSAYVQHVAVAAVSLLENSPTRPIHFHLALCDPEPAELDKLRSSLAPYRQVQLSVHRIDGALVADAHVDRHVSKEAYFRFLAPDILPLEVSRVIYLDCDLVVLDDIGTLAAVDLAGRAVAAVPDVDWRERRDDGRLLALGLVRSDTYFNSGVLVIDLEKWRHAEVSRQILRYAAEMGSLLQYHDQDALNVVLKGDIAPLDRRWNVQALMFGHEFRRFLPRDYEATGDARARPGIVHYTTAAKPWNFRTYVPRKALYHRMRARTAWRDNPPPLAGPCHRLTTRLLLSGVDLGLCLRLVRSLGRLHRARSADR